MFMRKPKNEAGAKAKTGPKPERLKLRGDWEKLVGKALSKPRPKKGWGKV